MSYQLFQGDCLEEMRKIPSGSVDMVLCDLPYGTTACKWDAVIPFAPLWEQYKRICLEGSAIVLFGSGLFSALTTLSNTAFYKYSLVWEKSKCGSPLLAKFRPMMKHEDILVFSNGGGKHRMFCPQMVEGAPYSRKNVSIKINNHGYGLKQVTTNNLGTRYPSSVLKFDQSWRRQDQIHPTQKPVALMEYLIKTYTNEGQTVLDNTMGSGTTGVACQNTGRSFIGIERDENYFKIASERIAAADPMNDPAFL